MKNDTKLTEQQKAILSHNKEVLITPMEGEITRNAAVLAQVRSKVSHMVYQSILDCIRDSTCTYAYSIVKKPVGAQQRQGYQFDIWVTQKPIKGKIGHKYTGTICIPLLADEYLKFHYDM